MSRNAAAAAVVEPETEAALQAAYGALRTGDLDAAERAFRHVLDTTHARAKALNGLGIVAAMRGQSGLAVGLYRQAIESAPDYALPRDNLIRLLAAEAGRRTDAGAESTLDAARELLNDGVADLGEARAILGQAYARLGRQYRQASGDANRVAAVLRKARALSPDDANLRVALDVALHASGQLATLADYTTDVAPETLGRRLVIACFPKSASTFLKSVLMGVTGFPERNLAFAHGQNETGLYLPDLIASAGHDSVTQIHLRPSDSNLRLMQGFAIRPIVLVRNIFDVLLSYKEFHDRHAGEISFYARWDDLDETGRFDVMVDDRAAWYVGFFAGWQRAIRSGRIDGHWLTYEKLMGDQAGAVGEILRFHGLDQPREAIEAAIAQAGSDRTATHFNKGVVGRGRARFNDRQVAQIRRIAGHHPDIDFSLIGL